MGAAGVESLGTSKALSRPPTRASCPPPRATIAPPAAEVKRLREGDAPWRCSAAELLRQPSQLGGKPNAAGARPPAGGRPRRTPPPRGGRATLATAGPGRLILP